MRFVRTRKELDLNLSRFTRYLRSSDDGERQFYCDRLAQGICFVVFRRSGHLLFAPSRFVGYAQNSPHRHQRNDRKDGRDTNRVLTRLLGCSPEHDATLEREYYRACAKVNVEPRATGAFRVKRKYWQET